MTDDTHEHPYAAILSELDIQMTLLLVRGLVNELSSELDLHYDRDRLRNMRGDDAVQALIEAARFLREHEVELPSSFLHLLLTVCEELDPE